MDDNNIMQRQESLRLDTPQSAAVVGCGGVGSWVALFLALSGVPELWLFDHDTIGSSNLNRVLFTADEVGKPKTEQLRELILKYRPSCTVYACGRFTQEVADGIDIGDTLQYVIAATDSVASRKMIADWCKRELVPYVEVGAEGEIGSITGEPADFVTPQEAEPGYASVPVWLGPAVNAAVMAVSYVLHGKRIGEKSLRAGWDGASFSFYDSSRNNNEDDNRTTTLLDDEENQDEQEEQDTADTTADDIPF